MKKPEFSCTFRHKSFFLLFLAIGIAVLGILPAAGFNGLGGNVYRSVKTAKKQIAITFDDGPHPRQTREILQILDRYGIKATFFMVGVNVQNYPQIAKEVIQRGHEVGNHTFSHSHLDLIDHRSIFDEIERCEKTLEELCEYRPHLFRPPEGAITDNVLRCARDGDYEIVLWSIDTRDWEIKNADRIVECVLSQIKPGDIILMHDYIGRGTATPQALERLLPKLIARGFEPVTVSRLIGLD